MDVVRVVQEAAERAMLAEVERRAAKVQPRWHPKVTLLHNPSAMCPWCEGWVETRRVWALQESPPSVLAVWDAAGRRLSMAHQVHPHVFTSGHVCMGEGSAGTLAEALWTGLNPYSPASGTVEGWLKGLGHECERMREGRLGRRWQAVTEREEDEDNWVCSNCDGNYDREDDGMWCGNVWWCDDCFSGHHVRCERCYEMMCEHLGEYPTTVVDATGGEREWCVTCCGDNAFYCERCERDLTNDQHAKNGTCKECWAEGHADCGQCGDEFETDELSDVGLCETCQAGMAETGDEEAEDVE